MNMRLTGFFTVIIFSSLQSFAQDNNWPPHHSSYSSTPKNIILFDPIFWKSELKLTSSQQRQIDKINSDFYESIRVAYSEKESPHTHDITDLLMSRSGLIWSTFHQRQKRKWEKLHDVNIFSENSERTQSAL